MAPQKRLGVFAVAKYADKQRPGIIVRFDWATTLSRVTSEGQARFFMALMERGRDPSYEMDFNNMSDIDKGRLEALWDQAAPTIDDDGIGWANSVRQRRYARYCSAEKQKGNNPMSFKEYTNWEERRIERGIVLDDDR